MPDVGALLGACRTLRLREAQVGRAVPCPPPCACLAAVYQRGYGVPAGIWRALFRAEGLRLEEPGP